MTDSLYDTITALAKRRGFYWPSFEIYGGLSGFVTYGDLGTKLKRNIEKSWRSYFVNPFGFLEIEAPLINPAKVFEASGHLENFKEYSVECKSCGRNYRADHLVENKTGLENVEAMGGEVIVSLLRENKIKCPRCGGQLKDPVLLLTMFRTEIGATDGETGYARPETAQGMFTNFKRGYLHAREKIPFALAQKGKVLRNEISPRRGMTRLREFSIIELELFFDPQESSCPWFNDYANGTLNIITEAMEVEGVNIPRKITLREAVEEGFILNEWLGFIIGVSKCFVSNLGVSDERQRFRAHLPDERAHYSAQTYDHEVHLKSWGWIEISGHAYRTDYDLKSHQNGAKEDLSVLRENGSRFIPHVVEPSFGLDRLFYVAIETAYERRNNRNILHLPRNLAPYQISILPLVTKNGLPEIAWKIHSSILDAGFVSKYDQGGSIGRRYARSDEIGIPLALTIDYDNTMNHDIITIRDRDTWKQVKLPVKDLVNKLKAYFIDKIDFKDIGEPL
jgi:glycyl-tRNA synthetase